MEVARAIPHVRGAALVNGLPGLGSGRRRRLVGEDGTGVDTRIVVAQERFASPGLFDTLGIRIAAGRDFTDADVSAGPAVAVVSQRVAATLWPEQHPIGRWLKVGSDDVSRQIVGVVADTASGVGELAGMAVYLPTSQAYSPQMSIVISTYQRPHSVLASFRTALVNADRAAGVFDVRTLADSVGVVLAPIRAAAVILGCLGLIAGALAVLGIYGAMAYFVSQRTREFGVRKALGATRLQIYAVPVRQGLPLLVWGAVGGLLAAFSAVGRLEPLLYGVPARDIPTFVIAPAIMIIAGLATCILAARVAAVAEPSVSLREL